jgi:leucyl aminopeptidase
LNIYIKNIAEEACSCDALIIPVTEGSADVWKSLPGQTARYISKDYLKSFSGKQNEIFMVPAPSDIKPKRILLIGLGKKDSVAVDKVRQAGGKTAVHLREAGIKSMALSTGLISSLKMSPLEFAEGAMLGLYTFNKYKTENEAKHVNSLTILSRPSQEMKEKLKFEKIKADAVCFAKDMINNPSNDMTPKDLAEAALSLRTKKLSVKVLEKKDVRKLGMGAYLAVARGSCEPPKFIVLQYKGGKGKPVALIGKSITFDSGGISLKPADGMEKMKYDMAGGAAVLGVLKAVSEMKMPLNIIGILPATENLPSGSAVKPGDIVRTMNGKTVEIVNTDAEGRLILADAIEYAKRFKPKAIIDIATLTGACSITFGNEAIAMMGNDEELKDQIRQSGDKTSERVWEMPLFEEYKDYIKSDIADIKNSGGRNGSLITSAYFLYVFAGQTPWVHLDIAGTAWTEKDKPYVTKGATGVGIRLILNLIKELK